MPVVTNGPVLAAFKSVLDASGKPLSRETEECSASVVRLLEHHHTTAQRPGMLLGKVQSGKTRAFVGAIAIAFDSGFDIAVVLTKTSKPLAAQTMRRLQQDLAPAIQHNRVRVYNAAGKIGPLNQWQQKLKLIFVAKKHPKNLENVQNALLRDHLALVNKKILIIDDEVDFASVGYQRRQGAVEVFLERDPAGQVSQCAPNKISLTRAQWTRPRGELVPRPFTTVSSEADTAEVQAVVEQFKAFGKASTPFQMTVEQACDLLDDVCALIRIDDGWDWDLDAMKDAVRHLAASHPDEDKRDQVVGLYTLKNTIRKWNDASQMDPQRAPYSATTEKALRDIAGFRPSLGFYHNVGNVAAGWSGSPFVWPVLFVPDGVVPTVFANNRRNAPRRRKRT